jgi:light-harvesting protein B-800-850 alpha chain
MNQGRLWTVVKPSVGLPLFIGAVAVTSLTIHIAVLTHTTWYPAFMQGGQKKVAIETQTTAPAVLALNDATTVK